MTIEKKSRKINIPGNKKKNQEIEQSPLVILNAISDSALLIDSEGKILWMNSAANRFFSDKHIPVSGKNIINLLSSDIKSQFKQNIAKVLKNKSSVRFEHRRKDICTEFDLYPVPDKNGTAVTIAVCGKDVTERKQREDEQRETEERYSRLLENVNDAVYIHAVDNNGFPGLITEVNEKACTQLGYTRDELLKMTPLDIDAHEQKDEVVQIMLILKAEGHHIFEMVRVTKSGRKIPVEINANLFQVNGTSLVMSIARDISERKLAENALKTSEALLKAQLENSPDLIMLLDRQFRYLSINKIMFGANAVEEMIGEDALQPLPPGERERIRNSISKCFNTGAIQEIEHKAGGDRWAHARIIPMPADGEIDKVMIISSDITERKRAEKELHESNSLLSLFIKQSPIYAYIKSVKQGESRVIYASDNFIGMIGISGSDMLGKTMYDLFPSEFAEKITDDDFKVILGDKILNLEENLNDRYYTTIKFPIRLESSTYLAGYTIDITESKLSERALSKSEENYRMLFREMMNGFAVHDIIYDDNGNPVNYRFINVNPAFERMTGLSAGDIIGRTVLDILPGTEHYWIEKYSNVALTGEPVMFENYASELDKYFEVTVFRPEPNQFACIFSDITDRKHAEERLIAEQNRTSTMLAGVADTFYSLDTAWRFSVVNPAAEKAPFGRPAAELLGRVIWDLYPDIIGTQIHKHYLEAFEKHKLEHYEAQSPLNGRWYEVFMQGWASGIDVYMRDITERRHIELKLAETSERLSLATYSGQLGVWDWKVPENEMTWDNRMFELYGITRVAFSNNIDVWTSGLHPEDRQRAIEECNMALTGEKEFDTEFRIVRPDKTVIYIKANGMVLRDNSGKPIRMIGINSDITDRKRAEEALLTSEEKYRRLFAEILDGSTMCRIVYDDRHRPVDYITLEVNNAFEKLLGVDGNAVIGKKASEILPPEELKTWLDIFGPVAVNGGSKQYEHYSSLNRKYFEGNAFSYEQDEFVVTFRDITERKQAEESLKTSEERLKLLVESVTDYIYTVIIESGKVIKTIHGPGCVGVTGYTPEELDTDPGLWYKMVYEEDRQNLNAEFEKLISGEDVLPAEYRIIHKNNSIRWVRSKPVIHRNKFGRVISYDGLVSDITERKLAEEALRLSEERYRDIFERALDGIFQCDLNGRYINVNPSFARILGYNSPEELILKIVNIKEQLIVDPQDHITFMKRILESGFVENFEHQFYRKDGKKIWLSTNARIVYDQDSKIQYYEGIIEDITERKRAEEEKVRLESQLRQAQKMEALGTFIGGVAHDFNNILSVLMGFTTLLEMELNKDNPLYPYVEQILSSSEKAVSLTKSLLSFSRKQPVVRKPVNLNSLIDDIEKMLRRLVTEDITLNIKLYKNDIIIMGDQSQLDQILFNLATNARDALPNGGIISITSNIIEMDSSLSEKLGYGKPGKYSLITFADNGSGMDDETKEHIFDPFYTTKEVGKGTGLGMSTVYGIVKQYGGHISIYSEKGSGTAFHIYFPLSSEAPEEKQYTQLHLKTGKEKILIAEDNESVRFLIRSALMKYGYTVIEAVDGEDAIDKFKSNENIDLMIIDSVMPKKNGREVYDEIMKTNSKIRVLFCSGYTRDVVLDKGIEEKEFDFISKPLVPDLLLEKIREILDRAC